MKTATKGVSGTYYHGSQSIFNKFDTNKSITGEFGTGVYLTKSLQEASNYGKNIATVNVEDLKLLKESSSTYQKIFDGKLRDADIADWPNVIKNLGYDGIEFKGRATGEPSVIVYNLKKIGLLKYNY